MRFSTFSTGFSTTKGHQPYTHRNSGRSFLVSFGQKCGHSAFYKKESRRFFFCFYSLLRLTGLLFSNLEFCPEQFSTNRRGEKPGVENGHKQRFSTLFLPRRRGGEVTPSVITCGDATFPKGTAFGGGGKVSGIAQRRPLGGAGAQRLRG